MGIAPAGAATFGPFTAVEISSPQGVAVDSGNNVWLANRGSSSITKFANEGGSSYTLSPSGGYIGGSLSQPAGIAADTNGNVWAANYGSNALTEVSVTGTVTGFPGAALNQPQGMVVDASNDLWATNASTATGAGGLVEFNNAGTQVLSATPNQGFESHGSIDAVDGANNIWVGGTSTYPNGNGLVEYNASGTLLSPVYGYQGTQYAQSIPSVYSGVTNVTNPARIQVDSSGNIWVANELQYNGASASIGGGYTGLVEYVGLAAPAVTPLSLALSQGQVGLRPGTPTGVTLKVQTSTLPAAETTVGYQTQLIAVGGSGGGYTWTVTSGGTTLSNVGLSLSANGLLIGTPTAGVSGATIGVRVTDSASNTATQNLLLTVNVLAPLSITTTSVPAAISGTQYATTFAATGGYGAYSWSILNTGANAGQLTALNTLGLTLNSFTGKLSGTPTTTGTYPFTVQVSDASTGQSATASFTLTATSAALSQCTHDGSGNAVLNGSYAFLLSGFDPSGNVFDQIGSFVADGKGGIGSGMADVNSSGFGTTAEQQYTFAGTYSMGSTDNRGVLTVSNTGTGTTGIAATSSYCFAADTVANGVASSGRILEADANGFIQTGKFEEQTPSSFGASALSTGYAFGVQGVGHSFARMAQIGQVTFNGAGGVTSGQVYDIPGSTVQSSGSSYSVGTGGRGTLTLNVNFGSYGTYPETFIVYQVGTGGKFYVLTANSYTYVANPQLSSYASFAYNGVQVGEAIQQTQTAFTTANVKGSGVFRTNGRITSPLNSSAYVDVSSVGQLTLDGSGNASLLADQNSGGTTTTPTTNSGTGQYTVASNGYITFSSVPSLSLGFLYAPGAGFALGSTAADGLWVLTPQTLPSGGFTASSLGGSYALGSAYPQAYSNSGSGVSSTVPYPQVVEAAITATPGTTTLAFTQDSVTSPAATSNVQLGVSGSAPYVLDATYGASAGRFTTTINGVPYAGYIASPTQVMLLNVQSGQDGLALQADHQ